MRRGTLALAVTVLAASLAAGAAARPQAPAVSGSCGKGALVVLFWPQGHRAIRAIGFPVLRQAHAELYRFAGAKTYLPVNFRGYVGVDGRPTLRCRGTGAFSGTPTPLVPRLSSTAQAAISCGFQGPPTAQLLAVGGRWRLRLVETANRLVLETTLAPGGSKVAYAPSRCRSGRAPA